MLNDRSSCFTAEAFEEACCTLKAQHRRTPPYTLQTHGMVESFNGRVHREVLGVTVHSHVDLETVLNGFNHVYNGRRKCVLNAVFPQ